MNDHYAQSNSDGLETLRGNQYLNAGAWMILYLVH